METLRFGQECSTEAKGKTKDYFLCAFFPTPPPLVLLFIFSFVFFLCKEFYLYVIDALNWEVS